MAPWISGHDRLAILDAAAIAVVLIAIVNAVSAYKPMKNLSKMTDTLSKAAISFERIREVLALESQVRDRPGARPAPPFRGRRIALDGEDIRDYKLDTLRRQVSFVLQETLLFRATVAQNIAYGRPDATEDEIVHAARLAHADEFIDRLPKGYETMLGERGDTLSGGQRQRLAIARAIIRDAPILLMDEPSASLDPESEQLIFEGLSTLMAGRTSITIAHRLATVRNADVIFVLDHGVIAEQGTHRELLAKGGVYARLYRIQFQPEGPSRTAAVRARPADK